MDSKAAFKEALDQISDTNSSYLRALAKIQISLADLSHNDEVGKEAAEYLRATDYVANIVTQLLR